MGKHVVKYTNYLLLGATKIGFVLAVDNPIKHFRLINYNSVVIIFAIF